MVESDLVPQDHGLLYYNGDMDSDVTPLKSL